MMTEDGSSELTCPICFQIPEADIYQCTNGHIVCRACSENLRVCPQCRESYTNKKIRNRMLERILDQQRFDCPNKPFGCTVTVSRAHMRVHFASCSYRNTTCIKVQVCKKIGYSCDYEADTTNIQDALLHFENVHKAVHIKSCTGKIQLIDFMSADLCISGVWALHIFEKNLSRFLMFAKRHEVSQIVSFHCVHLEEASKSHQHFQVKYTISREENFMEFKTVPHQLRNMESLPLTSSVEIPGNLLKDKYLVESNLQFIVSIISTENEEISRKVSIPEVDAYFTSFELQFVQAPSNEKDVQSIWPDVECDGCHARPILGTLHHCLQCKDFDLCNACHSRMVNSHHDHLFTAITTQAQYFTVRKLGWNKNKRCFAPVIPEFNGPLFCANCMSTGKRRHATYGCADCTEMKCFCDACYIAVRTKKTSCFNHEIIQIRYLETGIN